MESVSVERWDHLGVVASVIKDLGLIEMIDARLGLQLHTGACQPPYTYCISRRNLRGGIHLRVR
jgi:hypothetical protein